jgi:hypothetical protein
LLGCYHDLRRDHAAWVQRIHAMLFHQGATSCTDLGTTTGRENLAKVAAEQLSSEGRTQVAAAVLMLEATEAQMETDGDRARATALDGPTHVRCEGAHRAAPRGRPTAGSKSREPLVTCTFVVPSGRVGTAA